MSPEQLSDEMWKHIFDLGIKKCNFSYKDLCAISVAGKAFHRLSNDDSLRSQLLHRREWKMQLEQSQERVLNMSHLGIKNCNYSYGDLCAISIACKKFLGLPNDYFLAEAPSTAKSSYRQRFIERRRVELQVEQLFQQMGPLRMKAMLKFLRLLSESRGGD